MKRALFSAVAPIAQAGVAGLIDDELAVLNPTDSYGVIWAPMELEERAAVSALVEEIDDINQYFDLEEEGLIDIARIDRFDQDAATTVYDGGLDAEEVGGPRVMASCSSYPIVWTKSREKFEPISFYLEPRKSYDVEYAPKCPSYPCNRTAKGTNTWVSAPVSTDFAWRSNWNAFNYWTTQVANYAVTLYSGDSSINYRERSCTQERTTNINLSWY